METLRVDDTIVALITMLWNSDVPVLKFDSFRSISLHCVRTIGIHQTPYVFVCVHYIISNAWNVIALYQDRMTLRLKDRSIDSSVTLERQEFISNNLHLWETWCPIVHLLCPESRNNVDHLLNRRTDQ